MQRDDPKFTVRGGLASVPRIREWARRILDDWGVAPEVVSDVLTALSEICTNVVRHGYRGRSGEIRVTASRDAGTIRLTIEDDAPPFAPEGTQSPSPERLAEGGYGLSLIHALADEITHESLGARGNRTTLVKREKPRRAGSG